MLYIGIVKWFASKNQPWGFIKFKDEEANDREVFAHYHQIEADNQENPKFRVLKPGQRVQFEIGPGFPSGRGTQAYKIKVMVNDSSAGLGEG